MLATLKVQCTNDFVISNVFGEDVVMLESGNTYEAFDTGDSIHVDNGTQKLTFRKGEFPTGILGIIQ
jgi:hypothetical protein